MEEMKSKVYVLVDEDGRILRCDGGYTTPTNLDGWVQIDEGNGDKFNLCQSHYFESGLYTDDFIPKYKLVDGKVVERTAEEIEADRAAVPAPAPTEQEMLRADVDFLLMMMEG